MNPNKSDKTIISANIIHTISCKIRDLLEYQCMLYVQRKYNEDQMSEEQYIRILDESQNKALNSIATYSPTIDTLAMNIAEHFIRMHPYSERVSGDTIEIYTEDAIDTRKEFSLAFETLLTYIIREFH